MKLNFRDPLQRIAADKYAVRAHVKAKIGEKYLIPLIRAYDRAEDIRFAELPDAFVLKVNHGSGQNWIVQDKSKEDERQVVRQFREWMATSHYAASREWPYKDMKPVIVAEQLLLDEGGADSQRLQVPLFRRQGGDDPGGSGPRDRAPPKFLRPGLEAPAVHLDGVGGRQALVAQRAGGAAARRRCRR